MSRVIKARVNRMSFAPCIVAGCPRCDVQLDASDKCPKCGFVYSGETARAAELEARCVAKFAQEALKSRK